MNESFLDESGRIQDKYRPGIYFDTSVLVDYWMVEGTELELQKDDRPQERPWLQEMRDIVGETTRLKEMVSLRRILTGKDFKGLPIYTPLAMLELESWHAEFAFKQEAGSAAGFFLIQRKNRKDIAAMLKKIMERWRAEASHQDESSKKGTPPATLLMTETRLNWSFAFAHGLESLFCLPIKNMPLDAKEVIQAAGILAFLQIGLADILHLFAARSLGCEFFASFDSDFARARDLIREGFDLKLLTSPAEMVSQLTSLRRSNLEHR